MVIAQHRVFQSQTLGLLGLYAPFVRVAGRHAEQSVLENGNEVSPQPPPLSVRLKRRDDT